MHFGREIGSGDEAGVSLDSEMPVGLEMLHANRAPTGGQISNQRHLTPLPAECKPKKA